MVRPLHVFLCPPVFAPMGLQLTVVKPCPRAEHLGDFCTSLCKNQFYSFLHSHHFCQQSPWGLNLLKVSPKSCGRSLGGWSALILSTHHRPWASRPLCKHLHKKNIYIKTKNPDGKHSTLELGELGNRSTLCRKGGASHYSSKLISS